MHVDEYQDTNHTQYRLTNQLAGRDRNLMVVGDPDRSVYSFIADIGNIIDFQKDFTDMIVCRLELNCVRPVASSSRQRAHQKRTCRLDKDLRQKGDGEKVRLYRRLITAARRTSSPDRSNGCARPAG